MAAPVGDARLNPYGCRFESCAVQVFLRDTVVSRVTNSRQWNWRAIFGSPSGT